jgi:hypothetical protein
MKGRLSHSPDPPWKGGLALNLLRRTTTAAPWLCGPTRLVYEASAWRVLTSHCLSDAPTSRTGPCGRPRPPSSATNAKTAAAQMLPPTQTTIKQPATVFKDAHFGGSSANDVEEDRGGEPARSSSWLLQSTPHSTGGNALNSQKCCPPSRAEFRMGDTSLCTSRDRESQ